MKKYILSMLVISLVSGSLYSKVNPERALKRAITSGDLKTVKSEFTKLEDAVDSSQEMKKHLEKLVSVAEDIVDAAPAPSKQQSSLGWYAKKCAKLVGGTVLASVGQGGGAIAAILFLGAIDDRYKGKDVNGLIAASAGGVTLGAAATLLGAWLFNKGMTDSRTTSSGNDAAAIVEFLEDELDTLSFSVDSTG